MPVVTDRDKNAVLDSLRDLGAKDESTAKNIDLITTRTYNISKNPLHKDKMFIGNILKALEAEKKVKRQAGQKTASYYLIKAVSEARAEENPEEAINPYLIRDEGTSEA